MKDYVLVSDLPALFEAVQILAKALDWPLLKALDLLMTNPETRTRVVKTFIAEVSE
jgi:hypothetical protein